MIKINLEEELMKTNKEIVSSRELLFVKEYDKIGDIDCSALERVGITTVQTGKSIIAKNHLLLNETKKFNQSRIFHISQIKDVCLKYNLRFLHSCLYRGSVDDQLLLKIGTFETAYGIKLTSKMRGTNGRCGRRKFVHLAIR
jgi:hypothetical protein